MTQLQEGWQFVQNEVLGMAWLNRLMGTLVEAVGLDTSGRLGGSVQFFLYDVVKILILLGCLIFIISYIQSYFPPERTKRILGRFHGLRANALAALLGTVTPFCSCSSIPLFIGFTRAGLPVAVVYVVLGLLIAVAGGTVIETLHLEDQVEDYIRSGQAVEVPQETLTVRDRVHYAWDQVKATVKKVLPYLVVGVGIGAVIHNWIPESFIVGLLGNRNPLGVVIATAAGIPMYADIFGTIPIAEALLSKGALLGVVLSFMMGVTTLSLPSLVMLRKAVKPKLLGIFVAVCTVGILVVGYFFNGVQSWLL